MSAAEQEIPVITDEQLASVADIEREWTPDPDNYPRRCDSCDGEAVIYSDELEWSEIWGEPLLVLRGLSGETCTNCGEAWFDAKSFEFIEEAERLGGEA